LQIQIAKQEMRIANCPANFFADGEESQRLYYEEPGQVAL
jgi:hypothetical protein